MTERTLAFAGRQIRIRYPQNTRNTIDFLFRDIPRDAGTDHAVLEALGSRGTEAFTLLRDGKPIGQVQNEAEMANLLMGESIYSLIDGISQCLGVRPALMH